MIEQLVKKNRSYRRFHEDQKVDRQTLLELLELARLTPSAGNLQPLRYILSHDPDRNQLIFSYLSWAAYLKDWPGPAPGQRPSAYILILGDRKAAKMFAYDAGIAAQTILLGAVEKDLGGCILASIDRKGLSEALRIPDHYEILLAIALGKPVEKVVIEPVGKDGNIKYWRDEQGVHHVPKRALQDLILPI